MLSIRIDIIPVIVNPFLNHYQNNFQLVMRWNNWYLGKLSFLRSFLWVHVSGCQTINKVQRNIYVLVRFLLFWLKPNTSVFCFFSYTINDLFLQKLCKIVFGLFLSIWKCGRLKGGGGFLRNTCLSFASFSIPPVLSLIFAATVDLQICQRLTE